MGTRAVYTFKSHGEAFHVYKHWDNQPICAAEFISAAIWKAWDLPRFEADEFAAGFIAANKDKGGDIRLIKSPRHCGDAAYFYEITGKDNGLHVKVMGYDRKQIFSGSLSALSVWAKAYDEAY